MGRRKLIEDDQLLAEARRVFLRDGIHVGSRAIAREIGISSSVLFQRFGSMEELFFAAMSPPAPDLSALVERARHAHAYRCLELTALELLAYFRQLAPVLIPLVTHPSFDAHSLQSRYSRSPLAELTHQLMAVWETKRLAGEIDCDDLSPLMMNVVGLAYGLAMFEWTGLHPHPAQNDQLVRASIRVLWRGVAPAGQRDPPEG